MKVIGKKDDYQSDFYEDEVRFADAVNGVLFEGREVVKPEELEEADSVVAAVLESGQSHKVIHDKVRKWKGRHIAIMVLENQSYVDYRMVLRTMRAEVLGYERQRKKAYNKAIRKKVKLSPDERVGGALKETKYTPIIILVLYMGEKPWDGARSLYELLELEEELKPFISDHKLNLYDYHEHSDFSVFKAENRELFEVLSCTKDEEKMERLLEDNRERYSRLDRETVKAIRGISETGFDLDSIKETDEEGEEVYNMCKAFEDHRLKGVQEGIQQGMQEGIQQGMQQGMQQGRREGKREGIQTGIERSLQNLVKNLGVTLEKAMDLLEIPEVDREKYSKSV